MNADQISQTDINRLERDVAKALAQKGRSETATVEVNARVLEQLLQLAKREQRRKALTLGKRMNAVASQRKRRRRRSGPRGSYDPWASRTWEEVAETFNRRHGTHLTPVRMRQIAGDAMAKLRKAVAA